MQKLLLRIATGLLLVMAALAASGWWLLRASLPQLDGSVRAGTVTAPVRIERDAQGVVTLRGSRRRDLAFALGYAHGQDRWFQMDLLRRVAAGELAALLGSATVAIDRELRVHRFRAVAQATVARASAAERELLTAYADGANAGRESLGARPFEYWVLRADPEPWRPEDSVLAVLTMFIDLQEADAHTKIQRGLIREALPPAAARFVEAAASEWDAALDGSRSPPPEIPSGEVYDLGRLGSLDFAPPERHSRSRPAAGSNNLALAGSRTASGAALIANDMHLGLRVPNIWYRARLVLEGAEPVDISGVTLPGTAAIAAGSNGHIAWGYTNSYADFEDVVIVLVDPADRGRYLTAHGSHPFSRSREHIVVKGGAPEELEVLATEWGPVIGHDAAGRPLALEWTAHDPSAVNFALIELERTRTVSAALALAPRVGMPGQNLLVGDADGHIGWTLTGFLPHRRGGDASVPRLSTNPDIGFNGWLAADERPRIVDPPNGQLNTANARVVGGAALAAIGDGGYDRGARAGRIAADLSAGGNQQTPRDLLAVELDDSAVFLARWQQLLQGLLDEAALQAHPRRAELKTVLARWSGHAAIDDAAYRLVRTFRNEVERRSYFALIAPASARAPGFRFTVPSSFEGPLWVLVTEQPPQLLAPGYRDWREFLLAAADAALAGVASDCSELARCNWGRANLLHMHHALAAALPGLGRWLDMPLEPLPGDHDMPRVQGQDFGASERFGVSPGHEQDGYFHMPGGQSGHPLSPYFAAGHAAWAHGLSAPFLPGPAAHTLTLAP